jgi:hypothetical protein
MGRSPRLRRPEDEPVELPRPEQLDPLVEPLAGDLGRVGVPVEEPEPGVRMNQALPQMPEPAFKRRDLACDLGPALADRGECIFVG